MLEECVAFSADVGISLLTFLFWFMPQFFLVFCDFFFFFGSSFFRLMEKKVLKKEK